MLDRPDRLSFEISERDLGSLIAALAHYSEQARSNPQGFPFRFFSRADLDNLQDLWRRAQERLDVHRGHYPALGADRSFAVAYHVTGTRFAENRGRIVLEGESFHRVLEWLPEPGLQRLFALKEDQRLPLEGTQTIYCHRFSAGYAWEVLGSDRFPEPPFLLTDQPDCRSIYRGPVAIRLARWEEPLTRDFENALKTQGARTDALIGDGWFGRLRIEAGDRSRGVLEAFAKEGVDLIPGEEFVARWVHEDGVDFGWLRIET